MKKYIVRAVCLAAVFLLLCSTAFAGQSVTLDKYGVSFTVPDGMDWVATDKADDYIDGLKAELEKEGAAGIIWGKSSGIMVGISSGSLYEKYSFSDKKDQQVLESAKEFLSQNGDGWDDDLFDYYATIYDSGNAKWCKIKKAEQVFFTVQGKCMVSFAGVNISDDEIEQFVDSFSFGKPSLWHRLKTFFARFLGYMGARIGDEISNNLLIALLCVSLFAVYCVFRAIVWLFKKIFIRKK